MRADLPYEACCKVGGVGRLHSRQHAVDKEAYHGGVSSLGPVLSCATRAAPLRL